MLTVTEGAKQYLKKVLLAGSDDPEAGLRLSMKPPGQLGIMLDSEAEVPRAGISVTRLYQVARNTQGELAFWLGRKKQPGKPRKGSGLRFDALIEQKGGSP